MTDRNTAIFNKCLGIFPNRIHIKELRLMSAKDRAIAILANTRTYIMSTEQIGRQYRPAAARYIDTIYRISRNQNAAPNKKHAIQAAGARTGCAVLLFLSSNSRKSASSHTLWLLSPHSTPLGTVNTSRLQDSFLRGATLKILIQIKRAPVPHTKRSATCVGLSAPAFP